MYSEIASNKRRSIIFIALFFVIWLAVGAVCGLLIASTSRHTGSFDWSPIVGGLVIGALLAACGILYSLKAGARLVLRVSGAVPADPIRYQQLHDLVDALAIGEGIPKPEVYVIDDPSPNAFATGVSSDKAAITFTTGLLQVMNREELEGVAGHEMSHIKNHDIRLLLVVGTMIGMAALLASVLWRGAYFATGRGRGRNGGQIVIVIFVAGLLLAIVGFIFGPLIRLALSRRRESLADVSGVAAHSQPGRAAERAQEAPAERRAVQEHEPRHRVHVHRRPVAPPRIVVHRLYDTHPPIEDRIAELEKMVSGEKI